MKNRHAADADPLHTIVLEMRYLVLATLCQRLDLIVRMSEIENASSLGYSAGWASLAQSNTGIRGLWRRLLRQIGLI
jgi:hypothetical protein